MVSSFSFAWVSSVTFWSMLTFSLLGIGIAPGPRLPLSSCAAYVFFWATAGVLFPWYDPMALKLVTMV